MGNVRLLKTVMDALDCLSRVAMDGKQYSVSEVSRAMGLPKTNTHRLLCTLEDRGFIQKDLSSGKYSVGLRAFEIGNAYLTTLDLAAVAQPFMDKLVKKYDATCNVAVLDKQEGVAVYVKSTHAEQPPMRWGMRYGVLGPLHATAVGKVLLAHMAWEDAAQLMKRKGLPKFTDNTIDSIPVLKQQLQLARERDYAEENEEAKPHSRCLAVPIRNHSGAVIAAISLSALVYELTDEKVPEWLASLKDAAAQMSRSLGYSPQLAGAQNHLR